MYKLIGHSLTRGEWFEPETQPMTLQERDSTTSITLGPDAPAIAFDDWLLDDDWPEGNYVWRVRGINEDALTDTRTVELEHVIKALDDICLGEVTPATIAGSGATTCTAKQAAQYILSKHSAWTLGDFEYSESLPYEFDGDTLLDALDSVTDTLDSAVWEYDLSVFPFVLHIRQRDNTVRCEMRGERNLLTLKKSISRSGMYTRIYPTGKNNLQVDGGYLSKNEGTYGRVDHRETDQSKSTKASLQSWAQGRLNKHCEPRVSIQISGLELSQETGETLDNLQLNKVCQCPLPEYGTTITERIVKKQWRDRRKEPETVTITLANNSQDVTTIIKEQTRGGGGGKAGAGQAKQNYLFEANGEHLLYEVFDECGHVHGLLRMTSESLRIAFENLNDSTRSEFMLTAESLRIQFENDISSTRSEFQMTSESLRIQFENEISSTRSEFEMTSESLRIQFENDVSSLRSDLEMTAESLRVSFTNEASSLRSEMQMSAASLRIEFQNADSSLRSEFQLTAESLRIEFNNEASSLRGEIQATAESLNTVYTKTGVNSLGVNETLYSKISQNAESITTKVGKGDIASTINQTAQSVLIQASKINLEGYVTATMLDAVDAKIGNLTSGVTTASLLKATSLQASSFSFNGDAARWGTLSLGNIKSMTVMCHSVENKDFDHYHGISISESDGVITVEIGAAASSAGSDSFNMADTAFYQNAVSAAINSVVVHAADIIEYQNAVYNSTTHNTTVYIQATASNGKYGRQTFHVSGADAYAAGVTAGEGEFTAVSVTPIKATSAIRIDETAVTLYNAGTVTKYDRGTGLTARPVVSSGGTIYYEANAQVTYKNAGTTTKTARGDSITGREVVSSGGTLYYNTSASIKVKNYGSYTLYIRKQNASGYYYESAGNHNWYYADSGGTQYYTRSNGPRLGAETTYYKGNGGDFTVQGTDAVVTPIKTTSAIRLGASGTYYPGDGGSFTVQGSAQDAYKKLTSGGTIYYQANPAATYYTKDS